MKPVLLLLPGMLNDASVWDDVAPPLVAKAEVRTMPAFTQDSIAAMAAAAWDRIADVPAGTPVLLAGFSMGGYVALQMLAHPVRPLAGAALVSTSARPETAEGAANREKTIAAMQANFPKVVDGILQWGTHAPEPALTQRLRAMMLAVGADTAMRQSRAIIGRQDHRAALARLALPVAVLCGLQDRITPPACSQELAALLPAAQLEVVDACGHMLPAEQPQAVASALVRLLQRAVAVTPTNHNEGDK
jgi:pimeloyl-ACP methyl ester carboxylesterase